MAPYWQPGVQYSYGDVVEFEGAEYQIIQPHRSQGDWTPPVTPALWGRRQGGGHREEKRDDGYKHPPEYAQQQPQTQRQEVEQPPQQGQEEEQSWLKRHETELEVGGGILAGVAAIGAGVYAYNRHQQKKEDQQARAWSESRWVQESQARTQQWRAGQYNEPVAWIWNEGTSIPRDAIQGGEERGEPLYICRAYCEGGLMTGKASSVFKKGAVVGFKKGEIHLDQYEILVGNSRAVRWVSCSGHFNPEKLGHARPVEGGREPGGEPIYIAQAPYHDAVHPGKACEIYGDGCFIPYDRTEKKVKEYAVLCFA